MKTYLFQLFGLAGYLKHWRTYIMITTCLYCKIIMHSYCITFLELKIQRNTDHRDDKNVDPIITK